MLPGFLLSGSCKTAAEDGDATLLENWIVDCEAVSIHRDSLVGLSPPRQGRVSPQV